MKKTVSRFLSVLLVLAMVLSGIPGGFGQALQVYAEGNAASSSAASLYQVEFTRTSNNLSFIFIGTDPVLLSSIFRLTGLNGKTTNEAPLFYMEDGTTPDSAFAAVKDGTDWKISYSGAPDESWIRTMTVKVEGTQYTYRMTFAAKSGGTWQNQDNQTMTWAYDSAAHTLTLSGTGRLSKPGQDDDFGLDKTMGGEATWVSEVPWKAWVGDIQKVVIEEGITAIGDQTFRKHAALKSVEIKGNTLTEIGKCAFIRCTNLTTLDLRNCTSLTDLGQNATASEAPFLNSGLTTVLLSPAITSLPKRLFDWSNAKVSKVNLSELVELTSIEEEAFKKEDNSLAITDASGTDDHPVPLNLDNQTKLVTIEKNAFRNQTGLSENLVIASPVLK
ncbi:MAG: leucine-rich repeat domain-containing protein, partial [Firmicutes bacterium]|nr:leucine-rich repeat domain-containing protein [Bacillota bacterium]